MGESKPAKTPEQPSLEGPGKAAHGLEGPVGPGLHKLLQGQRADSSGSGPEASTLTEAAPDGGVPRTLRWTLVGADVLLVIAALWVVARSQNRFGLGDVLLVIAALSLGAWLSCCAFLLRR
jgi:hypothetical protein